MAALEYDFEWDAQKAAANIHKHAVSFEHAATVFKDPEALSLFDRQHSAHEDRWITLGLDRRGHLLIVSHPWRETESGAASCRILSARKAGRKEAAQYRNRKA